MQQKIKYQNLVFCATALLVLLLNWATANVTPNHFVWQVQPLTQIAFFETKYLYALMHAFTLLSILPLSFDKKVAFYKQWKYLFPALLVVALIFWVWDIAKTYLQVWEFNPKYYTFRILNLPIEEWFFFITFPFAIVFIYECLNAYLKKDILARFDTPLSMLFSFGFLAIGFVFWSRSYTAITWLSAGFFSLWHFWTRSNIYRTKFYLAYFVGLVPFILVNGVFTGIATQQPIVIYNPDEYLGIRVFTIPLDDFVYNHLLCFMGVSIYEYFKKNTKIENKTGK